MKALSIRARLAVFYTTVFAVVLALFAALSYQVATRQLRQEFDVKLDHVSAGARGYLEFVNGQPRFHYDVEDREERFFIDLATEYLQLYTDDGGLVLESDASRQAKLAIPPQQVKETLGRLAADVQTKSTRFSEFDEVRSGGMHWRFHNAIVKDGGRVYLLRVGTLTEPLDAVVRDIRKIFLAMFPIGMLMAGLGGWWMARWALKPLASLEAVAHKVSITQLGGRLPLRGTRDELDRLAATFNEMFARLEAAVSQMHQFTAGIAHELRTPMAVLQGEAELALMQAKSMDEYRRVLASQLAEFAKLNRMFEQLLLLARAEAGEVQIASDIVDLAALARSLVEQLKLLAEDHEVSLQVEGDATLDVVGDVSWLEAVVLNLLDNAIKFTSAGGQIRITVSARGAEAALQVRDTGIGIPEQAIPHLFERFFRVDAARSSDVPGVGLGLAIVKWAVEAQHGSVSVESQPGAGSCFTVLLPRPTREFAIDHESGAASPPLALGR